MCNITRHWSRQIAAIEPKRTGVGGGAIFAKSGFGREYGDGDVGFDMGLFDNETECSCCSIVGQFCLLGRVWAEVCF